MKRIMKHIKNFLRAMVKDTYHYNVMYPTGMMPVNFYK